MTDSPDATMTPSAFAPILDEAVQQPGESFVGEVHDRQKIDMRTVNAAVPETFRFASRVD